MRQRTDELIARIGSAIEESEREAEASGVVRPRPPLRAREALAALARRLPLEASGEIRSHRPLIGPVIVLGKRLLRRVTLAVLGPYLEREAEFLRELVRYEMAIAERVEALEGELRAARAEPERRGKP